MGQRMLVYLSKIEIRSGQAVLTQRIFCTIIVIVITKLIHKSNYRNPIIEEVLRIYDTLYATFDPLPLYLCFI